MGNRKSAHSKKVGDHTRASTPSEQVRSRPFVVQAKSSPTEALEKTKSQALQLDTGFARNLSVQPERLSSIPIASIGISGSMSALQRAFKADDPTSYDADGGHGYGDHGAHTTEEQHETRLKTGTAPSGRVADVPTSSSKFASEETMKQVMAKAVVDAAKDSVSKGKKKSKKRITLAYNISGSGVSYQLDASDPPKIVSAPVDWVVVVLEQTGAGKWDKQYDKIVTMFPSATPPKAYDN